MHNDPFMQAAIEEAKKGAAEGGIPIGSVLVKDGKAEIIVKRQTYEHMIANEVIPESLL